MLKYELNKHNMLITSGAAGSTHQTHIRRRDGLLIITNY